MPSLEELVRLHTDLDADDMGWLQRLVADWQMVADLSFADLVLWLPDREGGYRTGAQMRPTTGPTAYVDDVVGDEVGPGQPRPARRCRRRRTDRSRGRPRVARRGPGAGRGDPGATRRTG